MLLTIVVILLAMLAVAALELWLFWRVGERDDRRRIRERLDIDTADAEARRADARSAEGRHHATAALARLRGRSKSPTVASNTAAGHRRLSAHR